MIEHLITRHRIPAEIRESRGHACEIPAGDEDGTLFEINIERPFGFAVKHAEVQQQVGDGPVAVSGG